MHNDYKVSYKFNTDAHEIEVVKRSNYSLSHSTICVEVKEKGDSPNSVYLEESTLIAIMREIERIKNA